MITGSLPHARGRLPNDDPTARRERDFPKRIPQSQPLLTQLDGSQGLPTARWQRSLP